MMTKLRHTLHLAEVALYCEVDLNDTDNESSRWTEGEWNDFDSKRTMLERIMEKEKAEPGYLAAHKPILARIIDWIEWCKSHLEWEEYRQLWSIPIATFSDYSGSQVERANAKVLMKRYPWLSQRDGGHGTEWLGISPPDLFDVDPQSFEEFRNDVTSLDDYPCLDEEALSECEREAETEALDNWALDDFKSAVEKMLINADDLTEEAAESLVELFNEVNSDYLTRFFYKAAEKANEYWIIETGGGAWIDVKKVANSLTTEDVEDFLVEVEQDKSGKVALEQAQAVISAVEELFPKPPGRKWLD